MMRREAKIILQLAALFIGVNEVALAENRFTINLMAAFEFPSVENENGASSYESKHQLQQFIPTIDLDISANYGVRIEAEFTESPIQYRALYLRMIQNVDLPAMWFGQKAVPFSQNIIEGNEMQLNGRVLLTADTRLGIPGYLPGISADHWLKKNWRVRGFLGRADVTKSSDGNKFEFLSPLRIKAGEQFAVAGGNLISARGEYNYGNPRGYYSDRSSSESVITISFSAYDWNPDQVSALKPFQYIRGVEVGVAARKSKYSAVATINRIDAYENANADLFQQLNDPVGSVNNKTQFHQGSIQLGYELWADRIEPLLAYSRFSNTEWENLWERSELVINIYATGMSNRFQILWGRETNTEGQVLRENYTGIRWIYTLE
jgi:hypothetical protein